MTRDKRITIRLSSEEHKTLLLLSKGKVSDYIRKLIWKSKQ